MVSLEQELELLRPRLGDAAADALIARQRREVFSVYPELRIAGWLGATLLAAAAGVLLKNNLERIGPLALAVLIGLAAAACYAWTWMRRARASIIDDFVVLLGALLVSADVAFVESQFHLLGANWRHHLLILAVVHALGAYAYGSRMLLSLSISALAGWIGFDRDRKFDELAMPAFLTAAALIVWRAIDRLLPPTRNRQAPAFFSRTFEHFAANIALFGALTLLADDEVQGGLILVAIAVTVILWGFRTRSEPFVLYGFVYGVIGLDALLIELLFSGERGAMFVIVLSMIGAVAALFVIHSRFQKREAA